MKENVSRFPWIAVVAIFVIGLVLRAVAFRGAHNEGDELVYRTLVQQLELGRGYTLQGTPLIGHGWPEEQYGRALFFHPPGGPALFWLLHRVLGDTGYAATELLSYAVFYAAVLWLGTEVLAPFDGITAILTAALAAFTPLMTHVVGRQWLDGPTLASTTLSAALFLVATRRQSVGWAALAGGVLAYAGLVKLTALFVLPGLLALAWSTCPPARRGPLLRLAVPLIAIPVAAQIPWELWQWAVVGSAFPGWAGKPCAELIRTNPYVHYVTVVRSPWVYLALPRVLWTLLPSLTCIALLRADPAVRRSSGALVIWVVFVVAIHIMLGYVGYSKVLRYCIIITPATVLLFGLSVQTVARRLAHEQRPSGRRALLGLGAFLVIGCVLEVAQGIYTPLLDADLVLVRPLF